MKVSFAIQLIGFDDLTKIILNKTTFSKTIETPIYFLPDTFTIDNIFISSYISTHDLDTDTLHITKIFSFDDINIYRESLNNLIKYGWELIKLED